MISSRNSTRDELRTRIIRNNGFHSKTRAVILLDVSDVTIQKWILEAGSILNISFIIPIDSTENKAEYLGCDAIISDLKGSILDIVTLVRAGVVPIIPEENGFQMKFTEFDPMKFVGNAFLYEKATPYHIFEKLIRYLENVRYPGDKRILLSNLEKTF